MHWQVWGQHVAIAAAYAACYEVTRHVTFSHWILTAGLRLACLLLLPMRYWPALAVGEALPMAENAIVCLKQFGAPWVVSASVPMIVLCMGWVKPMLARWSLFTPDGHVRMGVLLSATLGCAVLTAIKTVVTLVTALLSSPGSWPNLLDPPGSGGAGLDGTGHARRCGPPGGSATDAVARTDARLAPWLARYGRGRDGRQYCDGGDQPGAARSGHDPLPGHPGVGHFGRIDDRRARGAPLATSYRSGQTGAVEKPIRGSLAWNAAFGRVPVAVARRRHQASRAVRLGSDRDGHRPVPVDSLAAAHRRAGPNALRGGDPPISIGSDRQAEDI
ncbi:hypothetical protein KCV01_g1086, partial [Aureobasidium melanogenum]